MVADTMSRIDGERWPMQSLRLFVAAVGGYAFANGYVAITGVGLMAVGLPRGEAAMFGAITGYFAWLIVALWAIASLRPRRTTAAIVLGSTVMIVAAPRLADLMQT